LQKQLALLNYLPRVKKTNVKTKLTIALCFIAAVFVYAACTGKTSGSSDSTSTEPIAATPVANGGFESQVKWGEHIVTVCGCNDCHTPKKMGPNGPEPDMSLMLSGHPSQTPPMPIDQKEAAKKGMIVTQTLTAWSGAWGTTFAVNLTPDSTGLAAWKEEQFMKAIREGKWMGLDGTRPIMPPMPWQMYRNLTDDELKAVFAFLRSIPAVHNIVPQAQLMPPPPASKS